MHIPATEYRHFQYCHRKNQTIRHHHHQIGIQRLQFDTTVQRDELEEFLDMVLARLAFTGVDTSEARQTRPTGIRYGAVGVDGQDQSVIETATATIRFTLEDEADAIRWIHGEISAAGVCRRLNMVLPISRAWRSEPFMNAGSQCRATVGTCDRR